MNEWQPIETAPKHEEILTLMKHGVPVVICPDCYYERLMDI